MEMRRTVHDYDVVSHGIVLVYLKGGFRAGGSVTAETKFVEDLFHELWRFSILEHDKEGVKG